MAGFVDVHSHMAPSGDDGVKSVEEGLELLRETAARGTAIQYATPHANESLPWTEGRAAAVRAAQRRMAAAAAGFGLDFRLGWEITPARWVLRADLVRLALDGLAACLIELPLPHTRVRDLRMLVACAEHAEACGLRPILAHPERSEPVQRDLAVARELRARGWLLQVNASSLLGAHRPAARTTAWGLVGAGLCDLVGSDGHRAARPPWLDGAHVALAAELGEGPAAELTGGAALRSLARAA
jgi:protein-tyrosine phosphatase